MFFRFDPQKMEVLVITGPNEAYEPDDKSALIHSKVQELKDTMSKFMSEVVSPGIKEIQDLCNEKNGLSDKDK